MKLEGPVEGGERNRPFGAAVTDLASVGYREDEYFLVGEAATYGAAGNGDGGVEVTGAVPFRTRMLVRRPLDPARCNGTVVVYWNNVSAGYDIFNGESPEMLEGGYIFVAVSAQAVGVHGFAGAAQGLIAWDAARYGALSIPTDDASYDIFSQAARAVAPNRPRAGEVDPLGGLEVERIVAEGGSQSALRLHTYVEAVHPKARVFDAFLIEVHPGHGAPLDTPGGYVLPRSILDIGYGTHPAQPFSLDTGVPVMVVNSETEVVSFVPARRDDSDTFRLWEIAGTAHAGDANRTWLPAKFAHDWGIEMPQLLSAGEDATNELPVTPVQDAALRHLHRWIGGGDAAPSLPRIEIAGDPPAIVRDEKGIAVGGLRIPQVEVPLGVPSGTNSMGAMNALAGSYRPFSVEELRAEYGDRATYLERFEKAARAGVDAGFLLERDAERFVRAASDESIGAFGPVEGNAR
jgi:hypothetical protein